MPKPLRALALAAAFLLLLQSPPMAVAQQSVEDLLSGVVRLKTFINPDARTTGNLGREREGSAIVIDNTGLLLTIGYLIVEAYTAEVTTNDGRTVPAEVIGYDHETGFGLLRAGTPLAARPLPIGKSAELKERDPVIVAGFGGVRRAITGTVVSRREFAGNWEYLLDSAIYTAPPYPNWGGAALIDGAGRLVGVGSLFVGDAMGDGAGLRGNMFVPIDLLSPIFADMLASGRAQRPAKPWLGIGAEEMGPHLVVGRVTPDGPAEKAGLRKGDIIAGVNGQPATGLADFYRKAWSAGAAGVTVTLDILRDAERHSLAVESIDRLRHLKLRSTF